MGLAPQIQSFLGRAARRKQWAEFGLHWRRAIWWLLGLYAVVLLIARLSAVIPDYFSPESLLAVPLIAALIAWFTHRRVPESEAAGLVDRHQKNHDLFLTTVHLDASSGSYQEQIRQRAEEEASKDLALSELVPWRWQRPLLHLIGGMAVLFIGIQLLPQLDPFGKDDTRKWLGKQEKRLEELQRITEEKLRARKPEELAQQGEEIKQALTKLEQTFRLAKPEERKETASKLRDHQKELGEFWKQLDKEKLSEALDEAKGSMQQFGKTEKSLSPESKAFRDQLREMLREGDAKALQEKLAEMLEKAETLEKQGLSQEEKRQGAKDLQSSLQQLAEAVAKEAPSDQLKETLQRAIEQMQAAQNEQLQQQAMEGGKKSMEQLQQQLQELAEQLQQLEQLSEALDAAQMAQQLNEMGKMPGEGEQPGSGGGMKDYAEIYRELLAAAGQGKGDGNGPGMGGRGQGEGGVAPEDDSIKTDFKTEKSPSQLVAGKTLLEWQTNGVSETGEARELYHEAISQIKRDVSEAIRQEKVPAGYHSQIQRYFDTLEEEPPSVEDLD